MILAGAPEAMLDEAILVIAFAAMSAGLTASAGGGCSRDVARGAALALSLAAHAVAARTRGHPQLPTGQRGVRRSRELSPPFTAFGLVPYLDGGYGQLGETQFFWQYNLPEVGIYLGILPVVALLTLLHPRWPRRMPPRERLTWYVVGIVGSSWPSDRTHRSSICSTAFPLYGNQRLQSRNMITVATAVCVLFAGWIDRTEEPRLREP